MTSAEPSFNPCKAPEARSAPLASATISASSRPNRWTSASCPLCCNRLLAQARIAFSKQAEDEPAVLHRQHCETSDREIHRGVILVRSRAAACKLELARIHSSAVTNGTFMTPDPRKPRAGLVC